MLHLCLVSLSSLSLSLSLSSDSEESLSLVMMLQLSPPQHDVQHCLNSTLRVVLQGTKSYVLIAIYCSRISKCTENVYFFILCGINDLHKNTKCEN